MNRHVSCIVCGCADAKLLYDSNYPGSVAEASAYFLAHRSKTAHGRIVRCEECGFIFTNPQFAPQEYDRIYQGIPPPPASFANLDQASAIRFKRLAQLTRKHVTPGPFLDFGCGRGGFLDTMDDERGLGFEVGAPGRATTPKGFEIVTGIFPELQGRAPFTEGAFSFVTAFDVCEHLPDLPQYLGWLHMLVKKDGHLVVTVPDVDSLIAKLTGDRWGMMLLEHLWYFSPKTLKRFAQAHGFVQEATLSVPYEAPLDHVYNRLSQTYGLPRLTLPRPLAAVTLPIPVGVMMSVFRRA